MEGNTQTKKGEEPLGEVSNDNPTQEEPKKGLIFESLKKPEIMGNDGIKSLTNWLIQEKGADYMVTESDFRRIFNHEGECVFKAKNDEIVVDEYNRMYIPDKFLETQDLSEVIGYLDSNKEILGIEKEKIDLLRIINEMNKIKGADSKDGQDSQGSFDKLISQFSEYFKDSNCDLETSVQIESVGKDIITLAKARGYELPEGFSECLPKKGLLFEAIKKDFGNRSYISIYSRVNWLIDERGKDFLLPASQCDKISNAKYYLGDSNNDFVDIVEDFSRDAYDLYGNPFTIHYDYGVPRKYLGDQNLDEVIKYLESINYGNKKQIELLKIINEMKSDSDLNTPPICDINDK